MEDSAQYGAVRCSMIQHSTVQCSAVQQIGMVYNRLSGCRETEGHVTVSTVQ